MRYGKCVWVFPDAERPPLGVDVIQGHESIIISNTCKEDAHVNLSFLYENKAADLSAVTIVVKAQHVRCLRTNEERDFGKYTMPIGEQYSIILESDIPIVAQYGRAEPRSIHFYTASGYSE